MASDGKTVSGTAYPPGSSRAAVAALGPGSPGSVTLSADGMPERTFAAGHVTVAARVGSTPRRLTFPDGTVFETRDNDGVDALFPPRHAARAVTWAERFHINLVAFVVIAVALVAATYRYALPVMVEVAVAVTPKAVPIALSQATLKALDKAAFEDSKLAKARQDGLTSKFRALAALTPRGADAYTLNFRKGGRIGPNAFALPDGTVVITDELIELARERDEMILGVLAHEIGHVEENHSLRQLYRAAGVAGLAMLIAGDLGSATEDILVQGSALLTLSYSRDFERSADAFSVDLMRKAGHDPKAIAAFFELLVEKFGKADLGILSTHPATPERIETVKRLAEGK
ncbi:MAG: M48 family metallopeptidase [Notoacmeibacter sp.]|nr:M48 family metallopeptidase [Notoacmeibacter sp.]MCC0032010.1 M48 family metallopeptidase [Brucellaceae bacterium]